MFGTSRYDTEDLDTLPATASTASLGSGNPTAVADLADDDMDEATRSDMRQWTGCIAGALTDRGYCELLEAAGLTDIEISETHRVHEHAVSAITQARRPA